LFLYLVYTTSTSVVIQDSSFLCTFIYFGHKFLTQTVNSTDTTQHVTVTILIQKLTGTQPLKKFPVCYGTPRFISVIWRTSSWSL